MIQSSQFWTNIYRNTLETKTHKEEQTQQFQEDEEDRNHTVQRKDQHFSDIINTEQSIYFPNSPSKKDKTTKSSNHLQIQVSIILIKYLVAQIHFLLNNKFKHIYSMKYRFFSPDLRYEEFLGKEKKQSQLRWVGSTAKLYGGSSGYDEMEVKVGEYTYFRNKELGSGYSSKVYKALKEGSKQAFAIKIIETKNFSNSNLEMLENQIEILKSLDHPNILKCYDVIKTKTKCHIVTEYCPDGDLLSFITKKGKLSEKNALSIIDQIANGCKYLLEKEIIHRDLKPANIIKAGDSWKIADFGFSIRSSKQLRTKHNVGTPLYMPPQSLLDNIYSPKSDIFSIGIILYELMFGNTPWESKTEKDLIRKMTTLPLKFPEKIKLTDSTKELLKKMCSVKMDDRIDKDDFLALDLSCSTANQNPEENNSGISCLKFAKKGIAKRMQHRSLEINPEKLMKSYESMKQKEKGDPSQAGSPRPLISISGRFSTKIKIENSQQLSQQYFTKKERSRKLEFMPKFCSKQILRINTNSIQYQQKSIYTQKNQNTDLHHIIINQLHYCRFQYYLIKNIDHLLLSKNRKQKLSLVLFKHLLKLIKQLNDKSILNGIYNRKSDEKKANSSLQKNSIDNMIQEYAIRYQQEYLNLLKTINVDIVREVNKQLPEFTAKVPFSVEFYQKILKMIVPLLRASNHELGAYLVRKESGSEYLVIKQICAIQALNSLLKYYRLIQMSINNFQNLEYFQAHSNIKVIPDYKRSECTGDTFLKIRKQIKSI